MVYGFASVALMVLELERVQEHLSLQFQFQFQFQFQVLQRLQSQMDRHCQIVSLQKLFPW